MTSSSPLTRSTGPLAVALLLTLGLTACSVDVSADPTADATSAAATAATPEPTATTATEAPTSAPTATDDAAAAGPTVPGYAYGEVPPVPLLVMPDLSLLSESTSSFTREVSQKLGTYPGITVTAATCDAGGTVTSGKGSLLAYGDGSGTYTGPDGEVANYGDGSGSFTLNGVEVWNYGDGSGSYEAGDLSIWNYGDGSGSYDDATSSIWIYGDGSGSESSPRGEYFFYGDGSASYSKDGVSIWNYGDGSASYDDGTLSVWNDGDGTGTVNGVDTVVEPAPAAPLLGTFPPLGDLAPITSCGTLVTLDSAVLFDPEKFDVRPDAAATLDQVATALNDLGAPSATVQGHTDSDRDEDYNQTLSENRASAVADALRGRGVTASLDSVGFGELRPVAPNEIDGVANPAGKQLNRRVEIFVPAF